MAQMKHIYLGGSDRGNQVITAGFLSGYKREVDAVVDCRQVIQPCGSIESLMETKYPSRYF